MILLLLRVLFHLLVFLFLTMLSQIGGVVYLLCCLVWKRRWFSKYNPFIKAGVCVLFYLAAVFFLVPSLAKLFHRVPLYYSDTIQPASITTVLLNRNYVHKKLYSTLQKTSIHFKKQHPLRKIIFLDANFPLGREFPLLPHLSHSDGLKIDLQFAYNNNLLPTTQSPTVSGYGFFENGNNSMQAYCNKKGFWQYGITEYCTLGTLHPNFSMAPSATADLIQLLLEQPQAEKIFIEPHLIKQLGLKHPKLRFHGCHAVRHDDHIHFQVR